MKWILIIIGIIICLILIIYLIGLLLPVKHTAIISEVIPANTKQVWDKLTQIEKFPSWRKSLNKVEIINNSEWIEISKRNRIPMKITGQTLDNKLVYAINSKDLAFGGEWIYMLQPKGDSTVLMITENGEVYNPIFRFISKFIIGHSATMRNYMSDLRKSFQ